MKNINNKNNYCHPTATPYTSPHGIPPLLLILTLTSLLHVATAQPSDQTSSSDGDYHPNNVNPSMAIIIIVLVLVFFITGVITLYIQCSGNSAVTPAGGAATRSQRLPNNVPRGLEPSKIESFPTFIYSSVKKLKLGKGSLECAICLSEFNDSDSLRLLTKCDHVFHADCIDSWLAGHVTCPVCRANLAQDPTEPAPVPAQPEEECLESNLPSSFPTEVTVLNIPFNFVRSHSTGHSLAQPSDDVDRFTLRLPVDVRRQLLARAKLKRATSLVALPRATSSRRGYRAGGGEGSGSSRYGRILGAFGLRVGSFRALGYKIGGGRDGSTSSRRVLGTPVMPLESLREPSLLPL